MRGASRKKDGGRAVAGRAALHEELAAFEEFKDEVLPMLRKDLRDKLTPSQIRKKYLAYLTARQITIGLTARDEAKSLAAIKDVFDREEGKAPVEAKLRVSQEMRFPPEMLELGRKMAQQFAKEIQ